MDITANPSRTVRVVLGGGLGLAAAVVLAVAVNAGATVPGQAPTVGRIVAVRTDLTGVQIVLAAGPGQVEAALAPRAQLTVAGRTASPSALVDGTRWRLWYDGSGRIVRAERLDA
ncbi:MAG TPA: hypothetical protein VNG13_04415 [Mycobacteriales bacterium]|nr:hypothetical protein [Mycobacteriales bacterium]